MDGRVDVPVRFTRARDGASIAYKLYPGRSPAWLWVFPPGTPPIALKARMAIYEPWRASQRDRAGLWFDWRGMGQSDRVLPESIDDLVDDLLAVTDLLGEPPDVYSAIYACFPTIMFAARYPDRWRSLTMSDPSVTPAENAWTFYNRPGWEAKYRTHLRALTRTAWQAMPEAEYENVLDEFARDVPPELWSSWGAINQQIDLQEVLPRVTIPVLVTNGPVDGQPNTRFASLLPRGMAVQQPRSAVGERFAVRDAWDSYIAPLVGDEPPPPGNGDAPLSPREREVLCMLASGKSNRQIAEALTLSEATIATHVRHILEKTGTANRAEATAYAVRNGLA